MTFGRRLRLFLIGVVLGSIFMYFYVFRNQDIYKGPDKIIHDKISGQVLKPMPKAACRLACAGLTVAELRQASRASSVNYDREVRGAHGGKIYTCTLEERKNGITFFTIETGDSINYLINLSAVTPCACDTLP